MHMRTVAPVVCTSSTISTGTRISSGHTNTPLRFVWRACPLRPRCVLALRTRMSVCRMGMSSRRATAAQSSFPWSPPRVRRRFRVVVTQVSIVSGGSTISRTISAIAPANTSAAGRSASYFSA